MRGTTASGVQTQPGVVAAPRDLPFGTRLSIDGIGTAVVLDRGSAIVGDRLDVWMSSCEAARQWGVRTVRVAVLE